jgi:hypothetical protein
MIGSEVLGKTNNCRVLCVYWRGIQRNCRKAVDISFEKKILWWRGDVPWKRWQLPARRQQFKFTLEINCYLIGQKSAVTLTHLQGSISSFTVWPVVAQFPLAVCSLIFSAWVTYVLLFLKKHSISPTIRQPLIFPKRKLEK